MSSRRIIIAGGGFAGAKCAGTLLKALKSEKPEVVLFNGQNHLVFSPLLAEVVGSTVNALDAIVPLRQLLPGVFCRTEEIQSLHLDEDEIEFQAEDGQAARMKYDHLVLACGSVTNLNVMPGMADHGFPLKTMADAARLRSHIMDQMELAEVASTPERRKRHLTFLVVGGGYSGAEAAGEINDLVRASARYFSTWKPADVEVMLIHSRDQILPEISPGLREFASRKMAKAGVRLVLNVRVTSATPEGVHLDDGRFLPGFTTVCTIGSAPSPIVQGLGAEKVKGRLVTEPDMRLKGHRNVWAVGDCSQIVNAHDGQPSPTTGQFAERQGTQCALNIARMFHGEPTRPFSFKPLGELCSIGGRCAVADLFGLHLSGFIAWFVWRGVYLFKLPTLGRKIQVGFEWAWLLIFPRDLAHARPEQTDRVSRAHYAPGEYVFKKGEAPSYFYVLKAGEVEVLRSHNGSEPEVVTVLGAGSFFGERALIGNRPRAMSVRARTAVDVLVMGKNLFTQVSASLAPLKEALGQALNRRSSELWKDHPEIEALLTGELVEKLMEPPPQPLLAPSASLREVSEAFVRHHNEFFYVSADGKTLEGVVTITDLLRAGSRAGDDNGETTVASFMTPRPVTVSPNDTCATAARAFREYRLKNLPVVRDGQLVGCIRLRKIMAFMLKHREGQNRLPPDRKAPLLGDAISRAAPEPSTRAE